MTKLFLILFCDKKQENKISTISASIYFAFYNNIKYKVLDNSSFSRKDDIFSLLLIT